MLINLLQTVTDTASVIEEAIPEPVRQQVKMSYFELAKSGGWLMIVLLLLSVIAI